MAKAQTAASATKTPKKSTTKVAKKVSNKPFSSGTGRRKSAVARVWLRKGKGEIIVNGRKFDEYFDVETANQAAKASFLAFDVTEGMTADINLHGGGYTAQASAVQLGIARALLKFDETFKPELRRQGFLTVDSRTKERKKYGQKGARAKFQFTKR